MARKLKTNHQDINVSDSVLTNIKETTNSGLSTIKSLFQAVGVSSVWLRNTVAIATIKSHQLLDAVEVSEDVIENNNRKIDLMLK